MKPNCNCGDIDPSKITVTFESVPIASVSMVAEPIMAGMNYGILTGDRLLMCPKMLDKFLAADQDELKRLGETFTVKQIPDLSLCSDYLVQPPPIEFKDELDVKSIVQRWRYR